MTNPLHKIRVLLASFIIALVLSGITAFPLLHELNLLCSILGLGDTQSSRSGMGWWILHVRDGLRDTYARYPFIAYGTDWLAFGHLIIALFFIGPFVDPRRNIWILYAGVIACLAVLPLALICGPIRDIPFYWRLIDCSFGVIGLFPLVLAIRLTRQLPP
jgi:hypothetical protein